jgi:hypothetical protein
MRGLLPGSARSAGRCCLLWAAPPCTIGNVSDCGELWHLVQEIDHVGTVGISISIIAAQPTDAALHHMSPVLRTPEPGHSLAPAVPAHSARG